MTEDELLREFVREEHTSEGLRILVRVISWSGPHTPETEWVPWKILSEIPETKALADLRTELLSDKRYFGLCAECGKRNPKGWMHREELCQTCAQENHGIVY